MRGFRRTLLLSHLSLVVLTVLLMLVVFRNFAPGYFSGLIRDRLITHAARARDVIAPKITDDGFDLYLTRQDLATLQLELRQYAHDNQIRVVVVSRDLRVLSDSGWGESNRVAVDGSTTRAPSDSSLSNGADEYDDLVLSERVEVRAALQGETFSMPRGSWRDDNFKMTLAMPIRSTRGDGEVIGCVLATAPISLITLDVRKFVGNFLLFIAGTVIIVMMLSAAMAQRLALPVRRLEEATRLLAAGDLKARAPLHKRFLGRGDELDRLTREFNAMAEKIEKTDQERRAFLADVSHELRTPLTAIKGSAETLRDGAWKNERMAPRFADTIVSQSDRLIRLVGDLLQLARIEAAVEQRLSEQKLNEQKTTDKSGAVLRAREVASEKTGLGTPLNSRALCERAASAVQTLFYERRVDLRLECDSFTLCGHEDWLEQLLINLLANAARYSDEGTATTLRAQQTTEYSIFAVIDEGRGIAPEHLPHLGERFYRVEEGRERKSNESGGSGLGLAICRRIALAHGGTLNIESTLGKGTTVTVKLPV